MTPTTVRSVVNGLRETTSADDGGRDDNDDDNDHDNNAYELSDITRAIHSSVASSASLLPNHVNGKDDNDDSLPSASLDDASTSCSSFPCDEGGDAVEDNDDEHLPNPPQDSSDGASSSRADVDVDGDPSCKNDVQPGRRSNDGGDRRTGLVFESGSKHFDRHNRFHKERPIRVESVRNHLLKAKKEESPTVTAAVPTEPLEGRRAIRERCVLLAGSEDRGGDGNGGDRGACGEDTRIATASTTTSPLKTPEEAWLADEDFLRVHLPGYMQR